jgi:hypothetical protein
MALRGGEFNASNPRHTFWSGPWHYCDRCDYKCKIAEMQWERGLLLCKQCQDAHGIPGLLGERDIKIAQTLEDGKQENELAPVEKLRNPDFAEDIEDFLV